MNKEQLMKAGLTDEQATAVLSLHKQAIDGNYVPKDTFLAEGEKVKSLKDQLADRDKQITELGKFKGSAEQLEAEVKSLKLKNEQAETEYSAKLKEIQQDLVIKEFIGPQVVDVDDVLPKLDKSKITFDKDGKIVAGLKEQLDTLKQVKPHYFVSDVPEDKSNPPGWIFGNTPPEGAGRQTQVDEAADFGKKLAQSKVSGTDAAAKASDYYFKE